MGLPLLLTALLFAGLFAALFWGLSRALNRYFSQSALSSWLVVGICLTLGIVGFLTGYISGNTRESVIGDVVPVVLSGLGGIAAYAFVHHSIDKFVAGSAVIVFSISLFLGLVNGTVHRTCTTGPTTIFDTEEQVVITAINWDDQYCPLSLQEWAGEVQVSAHIGSDNFENDNGS